MLTIDCTKEGRSRDFKSPRRACPVPRQWSPRQQAESCRSLSPRGKLGMDGSNVEKASGGEGDGLLHGEPRAVWSGIKFSHCRLARIHNSCAFLLAEENGKCAVLFPPTLLPLSLSLFLLYLLLSFHFINPFQLFSLTWKSPLESRHYLLGNH